MKLLLEAVPSEDLNDLNWTENICFMRWPCRALRANEMTSFFLFLTCLFLLFLFPSPVGYFSQLFYRWSSTLHFVHTPSCAVFTPSPSGSCFFCVYLCNVHPWLLVCWSVCVTILKQIYHRNSEERRWATQTPLSLTVCAWCLFTLVPSGPQPDGAVVSEP